MLSWMDLLMDAEICSGKLGEMTTLNINLMSFVKREIRRWSLITEDLLSQ